MRPTALSLPRSLIFALIALAALVTALLVARGIHVHTVAMHYHGRHLAAMHFHGRPSMHYHG
jgi:hypothetical protein